MEKNVKRVIAIFVSIMLLLPAFVGVASVSMTAEAVVSPMISYDPEAEFIPGEIIVMLREPCLEADLTEVLPEIEILGYEDLYASVIEVVGEKNVSEELLDEVGTMFTVFLADDTRDGVIDAIDKLCENETILSASPNYYSEPCSTTPNDTYYSDQWALPKISAPEAWDTITDSTVRIAVLDNGFYTEHPDLDDVLNLELAYNSFTGTLGNVEDTVPPLYDGRGHGTHVAGIIAAEGNNNSGVCGVAWEAEIVPIRIAGWNGRFSSYAAIVRGILYSLALDIKVANLSYSLGSYFCYPLLHALGAFSRNDGIIVIAAGNDGYNIDNADYSFVYYTISANSGVIMVGASDQNDDVSWFSNYSSTIVDIFAPGEEIFSTHKNVGEYGPYGNMDGTSMAAPFVTGAVALLRSEYPNLSAATIKDAIIDNADYVVALDGKCVADGRLNVEAAMDALVGVTDTPTVYTEYSITISSTITNGSVIPSVNTAPANTFVFLTAEPNTGYWLKPGTLAYNNTVIDNDDYFAEYDELPETDNDGYLYPNCWYFEMPSSNVIITAEFYMIGDVDDDESVTVSDVLAVLRHVAGLNELSGDAFIRADVDGDGDVDNDDAQYIGDYVVGNITVFPIEI